MKRHEALFTKLKCKMSTNVDYLPIRQTYCPLILYRVYGRISKSSDQIKSAYANTNTNCTLYSLINWQYRIQLEKEFTKRRELPYQRLLG